HIKNYANTFNNLTRKLNIQPAFTDHPVKLNKIIIIGKNHLEKMHRSQLIYKINCLDCETTYVGQTKKQLQTRIKKHCNEINKKR
ncbi:hypothetical protein ALC60_00005, partial [Trachymyrmex zeteki]